MKHFTVLIMSLILSASLTACGPFQSDMIESSGPETTDATEAEVTTNDEEELPGRFDMRQSCFKTLNNSEKPEIIKVGFSGICDGNIKRLAEVRDLYGIDILASGVVGLVGSPIELTYYDSVKEPKLAFFYDKEQLRGIPEKNLIMLHYNTDDDFYDTVESAKLDTDECSVTADVKESGVYLLADAYQWYSCWGMDVSKYKYDSDPTAYDTDWEREWDTGSIMELADKQWAKDNAPDFRVSTPEQLASVVYYVNGINTGGQSVSVTLEKDIDLTGYDWMPMGWKGSGDHQFTGTVDGKGHTIKGMEILDYDDDCGFIGYGINTYVTDICFEDCSVDSLYCTGIVGGQIYITKLWEGIKLKNCTVQGGISDHGTIIGREAATAFKDCSVENVTVNGKVNSYFSYRQQTVAETPVTETFHLDMKDGYVFTRDEHDGFGNLGWVFERDGVQLLDRFAGNETEYDASWLFSEPGTYHIYLNAFIGSTYIRVSNLIEVEIK